MAGYTLVIGNKNYSSWSLRPWLLMRHAEIPFEEIRIPLKQPDSAARVRQYSSAGKVPILKAGGLTVWDSLAIAEFLAERHPERHLWPKDANARAIARAASAEMHSGFQALRSRMPMHCRARMPGVGRNPEVLADIARITSLWRDCRARYGAGGPFLFGAFSIADAMFAPVVLRFLTYEVALDAVCGSYCAATLALPALRQWLDEALAETEVIPEYEP
ncbi:MAG: glutathione S-transferase family protein [Betaproteobacteria bacterium]